MTFQEHDNDNDNDNDDVPLSFPYCHFLTFCHFLTKKVSFPYSKEMTMSFPYLNFVIS